MAWGRTAPGFSSWLMPRRRHSPLSDDCRLGSRDRRLLAVSLVLCLLFLLSFTRLLLRGLVAHGSPPLLGSESQMARRRVSPLSHEDGGLSCRFQSCTNRPIYSSSALSHVTWYRSGVSEIGIAGILRNAWSTFRLDAIRAVVQEAIGNLEALTAGQVLGREPSQSELEGKTDSLRAALDACCDELREGCGLPTSPGPSVPARSMHAADADWTESFSNALEAYRSVACKELDTSLAALALPPRTIRNL